MRKLRIRSRILKLVFILFLISLLSNSNGYAQQLRISDFVVFGGGPTCPGGAGQTAATAPGCSVLFGNNTAVNGGSVGSYRLINSTGSTVINGNIFSGGTIQLANSNSVTGRITAANLQGVNTSILSIGSGAVLGGNIDVNGNIVIGGGTVTGKVTHPAGTTYSGPAPGGGNVIGTPSFPGLPQMPVITNFPGYGTTSVTNNATLLPGAYGDMNLGGNKTITFSGPGVYTFKSFKTSGPNSTFIFDFKNTTTGDIIIYVHGDVVLTRTSTDMINGGTASRIYMETHGTGSTNTDDNTAAWSMTNGSNGSGNTSTWLGSVWAPYAAIKFGSPTGPSSVITGAFWSGTQVNILGGVTLNYAPYIFCTPPNVNAGPDKSLDFLVNSTTLAGSSTTPNVSYNWTPINGGVISTPANAASITVSAAGKYILTVSTGGACDASDTAEVTSKVNNIIGSELKSLYDNFDPNAPPSPFFVTKSDSVMIEIIVRENKYNEVLTLLQTAPYGLTDIIPNGSDNFIITGKFPILNLPKLDLLPTLINYCRPLFRAIEKVGIATTSGDTALRTDFLRNGFNLNGDSIKVGVLSDSYNTKPGNPAQTDIANGDLPGTGNPLGNNAPVEVLQEYPFGLGSDEGRAMLQIVHDIAPKAKLAFRTGFISAGDMAQGIRQLKQVSNCDIIVDDITFITEPFFQDGTIVRAINDVSAQGATYFTSAGNFANKSYDGTFNPAPAPNGLPGFAHNFGAGIYQSVSFNSAGNYTIVLQWEDSIYSLGQTMTGAQNDLDIYLVDNNGIIISAFNRVNINGDPIEVLSTTFPAPTTANILITRSSGTTNVKFKYVIFRGNATINNYNTGAYSTIVGHGNAEEAFTIGAVRYNKTPVYGVNPPQIESFSSYGGTTVNNTIRNKPDFTAPDGGNTSVSFGAGVLDLEGDGLPNFYGTSAAAPHAAAVAALIKQARKRYYSEDYSNSDLKALLASTTLDMNIPGFDFISGHGYIRADAAIQAFASATPSLITLVVPDNVTVGTQPFTVTIKGNYLSDDTKILFREDTITATFVDDSTMTAEIPAFVGNPAIQAYTPSITPSGADGGLSNVITFYDVVKKSIKVFADNKSIKYGEVLPAFTATITVDDVPLASSGLTLSDIGLDNMVFTTPATTSSSVNKYIIHPSRTFDPNNSTDVGLNELYTYSFTDGFLDIIKMPLVVTAADTSIYYGEYVGGFTFNYEFDQTNVANPEALLNEIKAYHQAFMPNNALAVIENGESLTDSDLHNLNMMASFRAINNSRKFELVNNKLTPVTDPNSFDIQYIVDISAQSIIDYNSDSSVSSFISAWPGINSRALLSANVLANNTGKIDVNGSLVQMVNGSLVQMVNTTSGPMVPIVNGSLVQIVNGSLVQMVNGIPEPIPNSSLVQMVNGSLVQLVNGEFVPIPNGSLVQLVNGSLVQLVNGSLVQMVNGSLVQLVNGVYEPIPNGSLVQLVNGSLVQMVNGVYEPVLNGSLVQLVNGSLVQMVNGSLVQLVNGDGSTVLPVINSSLVQLVNGNLVQLVNGQYQPIPNGSLVQMVNGSLVQMVNGSLVQMVNGSLVQMVNGSLVQMVNGSLVQMVNSSVLGSGISNSNTAVIIDQADVDFQTNWIGSMMGINMITSLEAGDQRLVPGVLVDPNFDITYGVSTVHILPAPITIKANDSTKVYGETITLDPKAFTITSGQMVPGESIESVTLISAGSGAAAGANMYSIVPGSAVAGANTDLANYAITYANGTLTVTKAGLEVTARNATKVYGDPNPAFSAAYKGFVNGETFATSGITGSPAFTTTATTSSITGAYPINVAKGSLTSGNYNFIFLNGDSVLTITNASLSIKANDQAIDAGDPLPSFTSIVTGLKNNDPLTISYTLNPAYSGNAGLHTIVPGISQFAGSANYNITFVNGTLYVNPKGPGTKKLRPYLDCVEEVLNPPAPGLNYIAHFYCVNDNAAPVYVPIGTDNKLSSSGLFDGSQQPVLFMPGRTDFNVYFDGSTLKWTLRTYETNKKSSTTTSSSSSSGRCSEIITLSRSVVNDVPVDLLQGNGGVYPNPARTSVTVYLPDETIDQKGTLLADMNGKIYPVKITKNISFHAFEMDISALSQGLYLIRVKTETGIKTLRLLKTR